MLATKIMNLSCQINLMADSSKKSNHIIYIVIYRPLEKDRYMAPDIENITKLLREGKVSEFHFVS